jgi:L-2-hydroxyglutarate oxidase LhgO
VLALDGIMAKAAANGVHDLQKLTAAQVQALEPALQCEAALLSPSTGVVDSHGYMLALQGDMENAGGLLALVSPVQHIGLQHGIATHPIRVTTQDGTELACKVLVNAAGLSAVALARSMDGLDPSLLAQSFPRAYFAKGNYFTLAGKAPFSRLIYPVPEKAGLGVHLTLDLGGQAKFGPDVQWVDDPADLQVDPRRGDAFYAEVRKYWPGLADGALQPGYAGMRPKINAPHEVAADFLIQGPAEHGVPGLVNLLGIESPGLTSSLAIAAQVSSLLSMKKAM